MPRTIAQLTNAGLPDVIDVEISSSSLDGANYCVLAYEQCHLTDKVQLEAVAQIYSNAAHRVDLHMPQISLIPVSRTLCAMRQKGQASDMLRVMCFKMTRDGAWCTYSIDGALEALADKAICKTEICIACVLDGRVCQPVANCHSLQLERICSHLQCTCLAQAGGAQLGPTVAFQNCLMDCQEELKEP